MSYLHGSDEWKMFDFYGPVLIGIFLFVFAVMLRGAGLLQTGFDLAVIWAFVAAFFTLAQVGFRRKRAKARQAVSLAHAD